MKNTIGKINKKIDNLDINLLSKNIDEQIRLIFGYNGQYLKLEYKEDLEFINKLEGKNLNELINIFNTEASNFKNMNYSKNRDSSIIDENINNNKNVINNIGNIFSYISNKYNINEGVFKGILGIENFRKKLIELNEEGIINYNNNKNINEFININYENNLSNIIFDLDIFFKNIKKEILKEFKNEGIINIIGNLLTDDYKVEISNKFKNKIFNNEYSSKNIYKILSLLDDINELYVELKNGKTFFLNKGFYSNDYYNIVYNELGGDLKNISAFDNNIYGISDLKPDLIKSIINGKIGGYRDNKIYIPYGTLDIVEEKIGKINPYIGLLFNFKGVKYSELGNAKVENKINKLLLNPLYDYKYLNNLFNNKVINNIYDITKYQGNINFFNKDFYHENDNFQEKIIDKFKNGKQINLKEFLYFCNYKLKNLDFDEHNINYIYGNYKEIKEKINKYDYIIISNFKTSGLNEFNNSDILTFSYKIVKRENMEEIRSKTYYIDKYKENITEGALNNFDIDNYNKNNKISKEEFIKGFQTLIGKNNLFVFHNGYNFGINILKTNFNDFNIKIDGLNVLDTILLFREYYKNKQNKDFNIYSYSLDNLSKKFYIKNNKNFENDLLDKEVNILFDLFKSYLNY